MDSGVNGSQEFDKQDMEQNKIMALLSYIGILVLIPLFGAKESKFTRFHVNQGLALLGLDIVCIIIRIIFGFIQVTQVKYIWGIPYEVQVTPWYLLLIVWIICIFITVLAIIGIINAVTGKAKKLPIIGNFNILK